MIINHNLSSMNTHRILGMNNSKVEKSLERLSSGLRINRAGDDAAGLAISEKMRGQIRGLHQASRNAQDGISLIQTAEGALNETHDILQRMRELAVQAANDTNTDNDRGEIQKEINQLISEVDRIGNDTEFNTMKLLNVNSASAVSDIVRANVLRGLKEGWLELAEKRVQQVYGLTGTGATKLQIVLAVGAPYGELAHVGGTAAILELHIDLTDFADGDWENGSNSLGKGFYDDRIIAHEMVHAIMDDALGVAKMNVMQTWFKEGTAEFVPGADERLKDVIGTAGALDAGKVAALVTRANNLLNGAAWNGDNLDYSAGYVIVKYLHTLVTGAGNTFADIMNDIQTSGAAGNVAVENAIVSNTGLLDFAAFKASFAANANNYVTTGITLDWGGDEADTGSILGSDHGGAALNAEDVIKEGDAVDTVDGQPLAHFEVLWPAEVVAGSSTDGSITLQIGSNEGQILTIQLQDMRAGALGIDNIDVSTHTNASNAIGKIQAAIDKVSSFRAQLGAYQNRLEHTIKNLDISAENLQASESRIRDVDMSQEMMNYTKNNILLQAAQAMFAQANQAPQGVLLLLR